MPRVIGIDPGTVSVDICGLDEGKVFLDRSLPTSQALADPSTFMGRVTSNETIDNQVNSIKKLLESRVDQARQIYGGGMSPRAASAPASPAPAPKDERPPLSSFAR